MILLHGFTQTRSAWRLTVRALGGRYRALVPDLPGHGSAAHRTAGFDACAALVRALADDAAPVTLCGYSMGGRIALHTALALPGTVGRLVLVGASPGLADPAERAARRAADAALAERITQIGIEAFAREWATLPLFAGEPPRVRAAAHADRLRNTPAGLASALRGLGTGAMTPLHDRLAELRMPVTLAAGERDGKFRGIAEQMATRIPDATIAVIGDAGHAAHLERPEAVAALLGQRSSGSASSASA